MSLDSGSDVRIVEMALERSATAVPVIWHDHFGFRAHAAVVMVLSKPHAKMASCSSA